MRHVSRLSIFVFSLIPAIPMCQGRAIGLQDEPNHIESIALHGKYVNVEYGYAVLIPKGVLAYRLQPPAPNHGITLRVKKSRLWINGEYDAAGSGSLDAFAKAQLEFWVARGFKITANSPTQLDGIPARDVALRHPHSDSQIDDETTYIRLVLAFRNVHGGVGIVYTIGLEGQVNDAGSEAYFAAIVRSFRQYGLPR